MTWAAPTGRRRAVHLHLWATEEEAALIKERMAATNITSFGAFARKMLIDGYHVNIDLSDVREMVSLLRRVSNNVNQVARRVNESCSVHGADVDSLKQDYEALWEAAGKILSGLARIE
jgi:hypothetical protein